VSLLLDFDPDDDFLKESFKDKVKGSKVGTAKKEETEKGFADYESMEACVLDNQDKDDPQAYCQELQRLSEEQSVDESAENAEKGECPACNGKKKVPHGEDGIEDCKICKGTGEVAEKAELTGPIIFKAAKKQIAYAPVLVPGEPDSDGEVLTAEKIEEVSHNWMAEYRNIDLQHTLNNIDAIPVESYITPQEMSVKIDGEDVVIPQGSWILAAKFRDPAIWAGVMKGELGGFSVMGVRRAAIKEAATKSESVAFKRTLLEDLGEDWVATHVSVVDSPAVPKAKWFALKSAGPDTLSNQGGDMKGLVAWAKEALFGKPGPAERASKEGMRISKATYDALTQAHGAISQLLEEANQERERKGKSQDNVPSDVVMEAFKEALKG
jgi:hypothetical protein